MVTRNSLNTYITPDTDNQVLTPAQPAFLAYQETNDANMTGDSTLYYLGNTDVGTTLIEVFDQNADFTPGASGGAVFTAPVTGRYVLASGVYTYGYDGTQTRLYANVYTSNRTHRIAECNPDNLKDGSGYLVFLGSSLCDMDAADIAKVEVFASNGNKVVGVGSAYATTSFSGYLAV